jgi:Uncharacterized conserved protein
MKSAALLAAGAALVATLIATPALRSAAADEKTAAATAPVFCVVQGDRISDPAKAAGKVVVNGKTYYLCCAGCKTRFDKADDAGKAKFAKRTDLKTEKAVLEARLKVLTAELEALEGKPAAAAAPAAKTAATAALSCAVTGEEIASVADAAGKTEFNGKTYYFCCPGCKTKFDSNKAKYAAEADKRAAGATAPAHK